MALVNKKKLSLYLENNQNVLFSGPHGVGKTAIVKDIFESAGLNWRYFSAATMDPWVDFIGVPRVVSREGKSDVLELIKPAEFADDKVEAIFFDEFNRAPPKIMNAVMELLQFKSINGRKFNNLKVVWAAINPFDEDNTYNVDEIDPAVMDRFEVRIDIPNKLDSAYLLSKYGAISSPFIIWWQSLPDEMKKEVSPRRLDYAINMFNIGGELQDVLPKKTNLDKLNSLIVDAKAESHLENLKKASSEEKDAFFTLENTAKYFNKVIEDADYSKMFFDHLNPEWISKELAKKNSKKVAVLEGLISKSKMPAIKALHVKVVERSASVAKQNLDTLEDSLGAVFKKAMSKTGVYTKIQHFKLGMESLYIGLKLNNASIKGVRSENQFLDYCFSITPDDKIKDFIKALQIKRPSDLFNVNFRMNRSNVEYAGELYKKLTLLNQEIQGKGNNAESKVLSGVLSVVRSFYDQKSKDAFEKGFSRADFASSDKVEAVNKSAKPEVSDWDVFVHDDEIAVSQVYNKTMGPK